MISISVCDFSTRYTNNKRIRVVCAGKWRKLWVFHSLAEKCVSFLYKKEMIFLVVASWRDYLRWASNPYMYSMLMVRRTRWTRPVSSTSTFMSRDSELVSGRFSFSICWTRRIISHSSWPLIVRRTSWWVSWGSTTVSSRQFHRWIILLSTKDSSITINHEIILPWKVLNFISPTGERFFLSAKKQNTFCSILWCFFFLCFRRDIKNA